VVLDDGGPVGLVGVKSVQEVVLDPVVETGVGSVVWRCQQGGASGETYLDTWPSFRRIELICDLRSGSSVAAV
jgi:hypothetical protein